MSVRGAAVFLRVGYVAGTVWLTSGYKRDQAMSQLGQTRTSARSSTMSASPSTTDIDRGHGYVRFVPKPEVTRLITSSARASSVGWGWPVQPMCSACWFGG